MTVQVLWLNGCFGCGKTATATALVAAHPELRLFDPELLGYLLWEIDPALRTQDFRELPLWRRLVVETAVALLVDDGRPLVVPMSLFAVDHLAVIDVLRDRGVAVDHVVLRVAEAELRRRILSTAAAAADPGARDFRLAQLAAGLAMTAAPPPGARVVDISARTAEEVAAGLV